MVDGKEVSRVASAYASALEACAVKSTDLDGDVDTAVTQILSKSALVAVSWEDTMSPCLCIIQ